MPDLVPVDKQLSDDLEQYFALTTATELPDSVRRASSWRLGERQRRRAVWRAGGGVLAATAAMAAVLVLTLHPGGGISSQVSGSASKSTTAFGGQAPAAGVAGGPGGTAGSSGNVPAHPAAQGQVDGPVPLSLPGTPVDGLTVPQQQGMAGAGAIPPPAASAAAASSSAPAIVIGTPQSGNLERSVTAAYTVAPGSFLGSFENVSTRAVGLGGYVASSSTQPDKGGRIVAGTVALKVPAAKLTDFLNGMPPGFVASSIDFASVDHTAQFVDVTARLTSARARLDAVNALLPKATSLADIATLEREVETAQIEIDTYQGQLNALNASVDLATATISLSERGAALATPPPPPPVSTGFAAGWDNAVHVTGAIAEGIVSALPVIVLVLLVLLLGWLLWGRGALARRRSGAAA